MKPIHVLTARDAVCDRKIDGISTRYHTTCNGELYVFCSQKCLDIFLAEPERYIAIFGDDERGARDYNISR